MSHRRIFDGLVVLAILVLLLPALPVQAQEPTPENDANCVACHTHQYYLYDSGKWFCLCEAPMHCIYCHGGRTDTMDQNLAHEGLVLYPTHNQAERCRACHSEDYLSRVVTFGAVAGIDPTVQAIPTATPLAIAAAPVEDLRVPPTRLAFLAPGQIAGVWIMGVVMLVLAVLAYRCYKADCLAKLNT